jgi:hypothetical protein
MNAKGYPMNCHKMMKQPISTFPELMTRKELATFLRIHEVSKADSIENVIVNLQRMRDLPVVHISRQPLYWLPAVRDWLDRQVKVSR